MAHIRTHPQTGKYQVRWIDPWRKERSKTFAKMRDAKVFMAEVEVAVERGEYLDPKRASITLDEWSAIWLKSRVGVRPNTKARDASSIRNHLLPHLGHLRLAEIGFDHVQTWVQTLDDEGLAPATVRKTHQIAAQILEFGVKARRIGWNPARGVELPRSTIAVARYITASEIDLLADTIKSRFRMLVLLGGYCGMRWGEAAGLQLEQIDLLHRRVIIDRTLTETSGHLQIGLPKTQSSARQISMPSFMVNEIESHLVSFPPGVEGHLVTSAGGGLLRRSNFRRREWLPAVAEARLSPLRYHDLRHSHVALLIAQGEHPKLIADRLGHASPTVTMGIYGHLFPGLDEEAADRLDRSRNESRTDFPRTLTTRSPASN
jgi:integrase